jgi:peroxiredoxin
MYDLWQKQLSVFVFLRHFACIACWAHAFRVWNEREKYEKAGAKIYFIGNGSSHFISKFKEDIGLQDAQVYTDPSLEVFHACGFKKGFIAAVNAKSLMNITELVIEGRQHISYSYSKEAGNLCSLAESSLFGRTER